MHFLSNGLQYCAASYEVLDIQLFVIFVVEKFWNGSKQAIKGIVTKRIPDIIINYLIRRIYIHYSHQWGGGNVYLLVLSSWKVNIAENLIAVMGL